MDIRKVLGRKEEIIDREKVRHQEQEKQDIARRLRVLQLELEVMRREQR